MENKYNGYESLVEYQKAYQLESAMNYEELSNRAAERKSYWLHDRPPAKIWLRTGKVPETEKQK